MLVNTDFALCCHVFLPSLRACDGTVVSPSTLVLSFSTSELYALLLPIYVIVPFLLAAVCMTINFVSLISKKVPGVRLRQIVLSIIGFFGVMNTSFTIKFALDEKPLGLVPAMFAFLFLMIGLFYLTKAWTKLNLIGWLRTLALYAFFLLWSPASIYIFLGLFRSKPSQSTGAYGYIISTFILFLLTHTTLLLSRPRAYYKTGLAHKKL